MQNYWAEFQALARFKPLMFANMMFCIVYGLVASIISLAGLSLFIGMTGAYSLILGVYKFYALMKYRLTITQKDAIDVEQVEKRCAKNIAICAAVLSFLHFGLTVVNLFFFDESPSNYELWFLIFIACSTFVKIGLSTIQSIRTRKNHSLIIHHIKLADMASALIALALLQRTILYFVEDPHAKVASGLGGIFFSLCAAAVCFFMFRKKFV